MQQIESKIQSRIEMVKDAYLQDYQQQVKQMTEELTHMRAMLDEELLKQRGKLGLIKPIKDCFSWKRRGISSGDKSQNSTRN